MGTGFQDKTYHKWTVQLKLSLLMIFRYLGVIENAVQLYHKDKADFDLTAFVMCQNKVGSDAWHGEHFSF